MDTFSAYWLKRHHDHPPTSGPWDLTDLKEQKNNLVNRGLSTQLELDLQLKPQPHVPLKCNLLAESCYSTILVAKQNQQQQFPMFQSSKAFKVTTGYGPLTSQDFQPAAFVSAWAKWHHLRQQPSEWDHEWASALSPKTWPSPGNHKLKSKIRPVGKLR